VVFHIGGWVWGYKPFTIRNELVTKCVKDPWTWTDFLDKLPKLRNKDIRFSTCYIRSLYKEVLQRTVSKELSK
jgi:hypothetical protein